jgi:hypothetical protein
MIEIVEELNPSIPFYKGNINYFPILTKEYFIETVPTILLLRQGTFQKIAAVESVTNLYGKIGEFYSIDIQKGS